MFELRPYQTKALNLIRQQYSKGTKKVLLHLATGSGKTVIFSQVLKGAKTKGKHAIMIVRGRKLVDQASQRLEREGVAHGVMMAGHKRFKPHEPIQICSIDTLISRKMKPKADIIVIDEAHLATSTGYKEFLAQYPEAYILPVTATPFTDKSLSHVADVVINPITTKELIDQGYLAPPKYYAPHVPDLTGVKTANTSDGKDYQQAQLSEVMEGSVIMGDIATHWLELAKGRPTIAFCVGVEHSKRLTEHLLSRGIRAAHVDAKSSDNEREKHISMLENGELDILCNCGILCIGVDIPPLSCIILARPTKSLNLHIQQIGRGTRQAAGKNDFIVLDHAGNLFRHGFITDEHEPSLGEDKTNKIVVKSVTQCLVCYAAFYGSVCPECGNKNESTKKSFQSVDGNLKEIKPEDIDPVNQFIKKMKVIQKDNGYKRGWIYFKLVEKFGEEVADRYMPKREVPWWIANRA